MHFFNCTASNFIHPFLLCLRQTELNHEVERRRSNRSLIVPSTLASPRPSVTAFGPGKAEKSPLDEVTGRASLSAAAKGEKSPLDHLSPRLSLARKPSGQRLTAGHFFPEHALHKVLEDEDALTGASSTDCEVVATVTETEDSVKITLDVDADNATAVV